MPVEAARFAPFAALREFLAHKEKLFARMGVVIAIKQAKISELLPQIAKHFVEQRVFTVDDFVVREKKNEVFGEDVKHGEHDFVMLVFAVDGIVREIFQYIVHPTHIPFKAKAQAAKIRRAGNRGPGGGFFGDRENAGEFAVGDFVHALEKPDGVKIFAAAVLIGNPFALFARVIQIEYGSDRVHAESVDVVLVEPEERVGNQIVV